MDWTYNAFLGYMKLSGQRKAFKQLQNANPVIAQRVARHIGDSIKDFPKVDFTDVQFFKAFITFTDILVSATSRDLVSSSEESKQYRHLFTNSFC